MRENKSRTHKHERPPAGCRSAGKARATRNGTHPRGPVAPHSRCARAPLVLDPPGSERGVCGGGGGVADPGGIQCGLWSFLTSARTGPHGHAHTRTRVAGFSTALALFASCPGLFQLVFSHRILLNQPKSAGFRISRTPHSLPPSLSPPLPFPSQLGSLPLPALPSPSLLSSEGSRSRE